MRFRSVPLADVSVGSASTTYKYNLSDVRRHEVCYLPKDLWRDRHHLARSYGFSGLFMVALGAAACIGIVKADTLPGRVLSGLFGTGLFVAAGLSPALNSSAREKRLRLETVRNDRGLSADLPRKNIELLYIIIDDGDWEEWVRSLRIQRA